MAAPELRKARKPPPLTSAPSGPEYRPDLPDPIKAPSRKAIVNRDGCFQTMLKLRDWRGVWRCVKKCHRR